jgi:hypothetical protein
LLTSLLAGLFLSSSQPYGEQDMRGPIAAIIDEGKWQERLEDVKLQYGGREISVKEQGTAGFLEFLLRKGAHFVTFAFLALCWYMVLSGWISHSAALPWSGFLSVMTAALDEWHQTFTPDRTGSVQDVLLDAAGIATMLGLIAIANLWWRCGKRDKMKAKQPI